MHTYNYDNGYKTPAITGKGIHVQHISQVVLDNYRYNKTHIKCD